MFKIVGIGVFPKESFVKQLLSWGIIEPFVFVKEAEDKGRVLCGNYRVLYVRVR